MPNIVGFTQDPVGPPGLGDFHFDDGVSRYAYDHDLASPYLLASNDAGPKPTSAIDVGQPGSYQDQLNKMSFQGAPQGPPPPPPPEPTGPPAPPPADVMQPEAAPAGGGPTEADINAANYLQAEARKRSAPTPERWTPKGRTETVETEGMPYSEEDAAARADANINMLMAKQATARTAMARADNEYLQHKIAQPDLQRRAFEAQKQVDAQHTAYAQERADLQMMIDKSQANEAGFNANRWFESKGALGQMAVILGQMFGAFGASGGHGENVANKLINQAIDNDIATQKQQIESGRKGVDNALQRLKLRYGDMDQAESALRIAMQTSAANQAQMIVAGNQSQDIQNAFQEYLAQNQIDRTNTEQKFMASSYGKHTVKMDVAHTPASAGGGGVDPVKAYEQLVKGGWNKEDAFKLVWGKGRGSSQPDAIDRKNVATIGGQPYEFDSPEAARDVSQKVPHVDIMIDKAKRLKALLQKTDFSVKDRSTISSLQHELSLEVPSAFSGSTRLNEPELHTASELVGDPNAWLKTDITGRAGAALDTIIQHGQAERDALMQGGLRVSRGMGRNESGRRERVYNYQTAPSTLQTVEE